MGGKVSVAEEVARGASAPHSIRTISVRPIPADGDALSSSRSDMCEEERHNGAVLTPLQAQVMSWQRKFCNDGYFDASPASDIMDYLEVDALADLARFVQQGLEPRKPTRWKRGELLGSGAYGRVYLGLNEEDGTLMAAKQIPLHGLDDANELIMSMEREIRLMSRLHHPNIVQYLGSQRDEYIGAGAREEYLTIFMEYVPGGSIASLLKRFGRLNETVVRLYTKQLVYGLAYLHAHAVVHRDIKGGNVLVDRSGVCKLSDFGASKSLTDLEDGTMAGGGGGMGPKSLKGTPAFMSPEVIRQTGYGRKSDIWSIGCTVIEMSTGRAPWSNYDNPVAAMFAIAVSADMPKMPDDMTPEGVAFLQLCFQRDPALRPTAAELLRHPFLTGESISDGMLKVESSSSSMSALVSPTTPPSTVPAVALPTSASGGSISTLTAAGEQAAPLPAVNPYGRRAGAAMRGSASSEGSADLPADHKPLIVTTSQPASTLDPVLESAATSSSGGSFTVPSKPAPIVAKVAPAPITRTSVTSAPTVTGIHQAGARGPQHKHSSSTPSRLPGGFSDLDAIAATAAGSDKQGAGGQNSRGGLVIAVPPTQQRPDAQTQPIVIPSSGANTPGVGIHGRRREASAAAYVVPPHARSSSTGAILPTSTTAAAAPASTAATATSTAAAAAPASVMPGLWGSRRAKGVLTTSAPGTPAAVVVMPPSHPEPTLPAHGRRSEPVMSAAQVRAVVASKGASEDAALDKVRSLIDEDVRATEARLKETDREMYKSYRVAFFDDAARAPGGRRPSDSATSRPTVNVLAGNAVPWGASPSPLPVGRTMASAATPATRPVPTSNPTLTVVAPPHHRVVAGAATGSTRSAGVSEPQTGWGGAAAGDGRREASGEFVSQGRRETSGESISPVLRHGGAMSPRSAAAAAGVSGGHASGVDMRSSPASVTSSSSGTAARSITPSMTAPISHTSAASSYDALSVPTQAATTQARPAARVGVASAPRGYAMHSASTERERAETGGSVEIPSAASLAFRRTSESLASAGSTAMLVRAPGAPPLGDTSSNFRSSASTLAASASQTLGTAGALARRPQVSVVSPAPSPARVLPSPADAGRPAPIGRTSSVPSSLQDAAPSSGTPVEIASRLALVKERSAAVSSAPSRRPRPADGDASTPAASGARAVAYAPGHARAETAPDLTHDADLDAVLGSMAAARMPETRPRPAVASYNAGGRT